MDSPPPLVPGSTAARALYDIVTDEGWAHIADRDDLDVVLLHLWHWPVVRRMAAPGCWYGDETDRAQNLLLVFGREDDDEADYEVNEDWVADDDGEETNMRFVERRPWASGSWHHTIEVSHGPDGGYAVWNELPSNHAAPPLYMLLAGAEVAA